MPLLSRLMVRTALLWLAFGAAIGGLMLLNKGFPLVPWIGTLHFAHAYILMIGWTVQLACGVAFWILPRLDAAGTRGREWLVWLCYASLNSGVLLITIDGPLAARAGQVAALPLLAGICLLLAIVAFVGHALPRVLPFRELPRASDIRRLGE